MPTSQRPAAVLGTCASSLRSMLTAAWDFVFPRSCEFCGGPIHENSENVFGPVLCTGCPTALAPQVAHACERCAAPLGPYLSRDGCLRCRRVRYAFDRAFALGVYDNQLRAACLRIKKPGGAPLATALGLLLYERHAAPLRAAGFEGAVPVPHHWTKRLAGGPNASESLARVLARRLQVDFCGHILKKTRRTPAQASLPPARRETNLRGAFSITRPADVAGRSILLVDDVMTTGTTANEAAKVLLRAGAHSVAVVVLARGLGRGRGW